MKVLWQLAGIIPICWFLACRPQPPEVQFVREKIPIEIEKGKPITFEIHSLSGGYANDVGIRCSPAIWSRLTNSAKPIGVRLKHSDQPDTEIGGIDPSSGGTFLGYIPDVHYMFYAYGKRHAKALIEITFSNAPEGITHAEIIVGKTPPDTEP